MNKEEILRKSREQKEDEGLIHQENIGRQYGFYGLTTICFIVTVQSHLLNKCIVVDNSP